MVKAAQVKPAREKLVFGDDGSPSMTIIDLVTLPFPCASLSSKRINKSTADSYKEGKCVLILSSPFLTSLEEFFWNDFGRIMQIAD